MGRTICGVGRDVRALRAPPAPPSSPGLLPHSKAGVEQWLSCSLVSRSQGAEHRKEDGPSLHFRPASSPTAGGCPAPPSRLCLSRSPSSRTEQRDHPGGVGLAWIPLHFSCLLVFSCTFICGMLYLSACLHHPGSCSGVIRNTLQLTLSNTYLPHVRDPSDQFIKTCNGPI